MRFSKTALVVTSVVTTACVVGGGAASASKIINGHNIAEGSITSKQIDDGTIRMRDLSANAAKILKGQPGATGKTGPQGPAGAKGAAGHDGTFGAYYAVAKYNAGDTNAGAVATVACSDPTDVAINGGVQTLGLDDTPLDNNTPVSSSFPGRMDWSTNTPKADRLDGWIVQFGGNAGEVSDKAPEKVNVWALCLPGQDVPVVTTFDQSAS